MNVDNRYLVTRRRFLTETGRGALGVAIFGTGIVACATTPSDPSTTAALVTTTRQPTTTTTTTTTTQPVRALIPAKLIPAYADNPDVGLYAPESLSAYTGPYTIREDSTIEDAIFAGEVWVRDGATLTVRNSRHEGGTKNYCFRVESGGRLVIEDSEIAPVGEGVGAGTNGGPVIATRLKVTNCIDGFKPGGGSFTQCHVSDHYYRQGAHGDGFQLAGASGVTFKYCNFSGLYVDGSHVSGTAFIRNANSTSVIEGTVIDNCYLGGGDYTFRQNSNGGNAPQDTVVTNNIFGLDRQYGHALWRDGTIAEWSNNVDSNGGPVSKPTLKS